MQKETMEDTNSILEIEKCFENFNSSISGIQKVYSRLWRQIEETTNKNNFPRNKLEDLAGNLAHEIRNPLGGIANFVSLLSDELGPQKSKNVQGIFKGIDRIDKIMDNFILFSRPIDSTTIRCNFLDLIKSAVTSVKKYSIKNENRFRFIFQFTDPELYVRVDPQHMIQALQNLLQNSIESMPTGGTIKLSISQKMNSEKLRLSVADEGCGIHNGDLNKPFNPFYSTKPDGIGLGLSTAQMIIEQSGGRICLKENANYGIRAIIKLPIV